MTGYYLWEHPKHPSRVARPEDADFAKGEPLWVRCYPVEVFDAAPGEPVALHGWQFSAACAAVDSNGDIVPGVWELGHRDEDGNFYAIASVDTGNYDQPEEAEPLARAMLACLATPAVVGEPVAKVHYCAEKRKPGGCQLHNLHCGYPKCDQAPTTPAVSRSEGLGPVSLDRAGVASLVDDPTGYVDQANEAMLSAYAERDKALEDTKRIRSAWNIAENEIEAAKASLVAGEVPVKSDPERVKMERAAGYWRALTNAISSRGATLEIIERRGRRSWDCTFGNTTSRARTSPEAALHSAIMLEFDGNVPESFGLPKSTATPLVSANLSDRASAGEAQS